MSHVDKLIERFATVFGEPRTPNPEKFIEEYHKALKGYEQRFLDGAADRLIRKSTFWPKPAEVVEVADALAAELHGRQDWDAIEKERREGWKFSDLSRSAIDEKAKARVQSMVDDLKANMAALDEGFGEKVDWKAAQHSGFSQMQRSSRQAGVHRK